MEQQTQNPTVTPSECIAGIAIFVFLLISFGPNITSIMDAGYYSSDDYQLVEAAN